MSNSVFNIVPISEKENVQVQELQMEVAANTMTGNGSEQNFSADVNLCVRTSDSVDVCLQKASDNGANNFNIFLKSTETKSIPKTDPRRFKREIIEKVSNSKKIDNLRYTRNGSILLSTRDVACAVEICKISELLGVSTTHRVIWENISTRFLIYDIPTDVSLNELAQDLISENNIEILELRRFLRKGSTNDLSPVLVTILGTRLPAEIKIWFTVQRIKLFVDRPRQCRKCRKFDHSETKCKNDYACVNCGANHSDLCQESPKCVNCGGEHRADYRQCPQRIREEEFLQFKCNNFLSFIDARRKFKFNKDSQSPTYAKQASAQKSEVDIAKQFELRTNNILKVFCDVAAQHNEKVIDSLNRFAIILKNLTTSLTESCLWEPSRKKQDHKPSEVSKGDHTLNNG